MLSKRRKGGGQIYEYSWSNALGHAFLNREVRREKTLNTFAIMTVSLPFLILTSDTDPLAEDQPTTFCGTGYQCVGGIRKVQWRHHSHR